MGTNHNTTAKKRIKKKKFDRRKILNSIVIVFLSIVMIGGVGVFFILNDVLANSPDFESGKLSAKDSTRIYDSDGNLIKELGEENRESVDFDKIPQSVVDAFLSIEDSRFYSHNGFDLPRFIKSAMENLSAGAFAQGGSTLTMQMIDNAFFSSNNYDEDDPSTYVAKPTNNPIEKVSRKIQEIFMSMHAEKQLSKDEIFKLYVNKINFGDSARGIQKGAQYYFGKDVSQVTLSEAAFLAGVINAPNLYNPYNGYKINEETGTATNFYEYAVNRRNDTLYQMRNHGYITDEEYQLAKNTKLAFQLNGKQNFVTDPYEAYLDAVVKEVQEKTGDNPHVVPMEIYTSMHRGAQEHADAISRGDVVAFPSSKENFQLAFSVIKNDTGEIIALSSGRDLKINRAYDPKQTGSSIKPILDYAPAFENLGWATSHWMVDKGIDIYGNGQMLANANGRYMGNVSLEQAVSESLNTTAAQALKDTVDKIGTKKIIEYMHNMGFNESYNYMDEDNFNLQYSIGGSSMQASPVQMAAAYAALGNGGKYNEPHTVKKIVYQETGKEVEPEVTSNQALSTEAAYLMSHILDAAVHKGYYNFLGVLKANYMAYGKTGTSDWGDAGVAYGVPKGVMRDTWMAGYTSEYAVTTWCGFDYGVYDYFTEAINNMNIPGKVDKEMLDYVANNISFPSPIQQPEGVVSITHLKGKFPYVTAPAGTTGSAVVTGLIKKDFAKLKDFTMSTSVSTLSSFNASLKSGTASTVQFSFGEYPGSISEDEKDILGDIQYKVDIKLGGSVVNTLTLNSGTSEQIISSVPAGSSAQFCGYYSFSNSPTTKSNEVCKNVTFPKSNSINGSTNGSSGGSSGGSIKDDEKNDDDDDSSGSNGGNTDNIFKQNN